jgi:hypothetical protein
MRKYERNAVIMREITEQSIGREGRRTMQTELEAKYVKSRALIALCCRVQTSGSNWSKLVAALVSRGRK